MRWLVTISSYGTMQGDTGLIYSSLISSSGNSGCFMAVEMTRFYWTRTSGRMVTGLSFLAEVAVRDNDWLELSLLLSSNRVRGPASSQPPSLDIPHHSRYLAEWPTQQQVKRDPSDGLKPWSLPQVMRE